MLYSTLRNSTVRKVTRMVHPHHRSNLIYNARSNRCHHQTSPNTAPVTQNHSYSESSSHMKPHFTMRAATGVTIKPHQILRLPWKMTRQNFKENLQKQVKRHFQCGDDPRMIRPWSDHDPTTKTQTATRLATEVTFRAHHEHFLLQNTTFRGQSYIQTCTKYCTCHQKWHLNFTKYCAWHEKWHLTFTKCNWTLLYSAVFYSTELYCTVL